MVFPMDFEGFFVNDFGALPSATAESSRHKQVAVHQQSDLLARLGNARAPSFRNRWRLTNAWTSEPRKSA
jgi:hypothetical protein